VLSRNRQIFAAIAGFLAVAAISAWFVESRSIPQFNVKAVTKDAPTLNDADIEKILGMENFRVVRRVRQVPLPVGESFANFSSLPFDLADPGDEISTDLMIPGKSSRRLDFLGLSHDSAVLVYEQGGFVDSCNVIIFWHGNDGRAWAAKVDCRAKNIASLRNAIIKRHFAIWKQME
jgi:hypothetical protein